MSWRMALPETQEAGESKETMAMLHPVKEEKQSGCRGTTKV